MTHEISISMLLKVLKAAWLKILIFTVVVALIAAAATAFVIPKKYSSSVTFFIINTSTTYEYTNTTLLDAAAQLANDYIEIIKSDKMIKEIIKDLKSEGYVGINEDNIRAMISSKTAKDVSTFTITATSANSALAHSIAKSIEDNAPKIVKSITRPSYQSNLYIIDDLNDNGKIEEGEYRAMSEDDLECIKAIRTPKKSENPVSPNLTTNTMLAAVGAFVISYAFFLVLKLFDTVIHGEESAKTLVGLPIIGKIPTWEKSTKSSSDNK